MHPFSPRGDFADNARLLRIATIAAVAGALSAVTAYLLLLLIHFFSNLFSTKPSRLSCSRPAPIRWVYGLFWYRWVVG